MVDGDSDSSPSSRLPRRPEIRAFDPGVHDGDGARGFLDRDVNELGSGVVAVPVQLRRGRAVDADAGAGHQVAVGDVVTIEVDRTLVSGGQMKARRMSSQQLPIALSGDARRRIRGKELLEPRTLREVGFGGTTGTGQHEPCETTDRDWATRHDHRLARVGLNRKGMDSIVADDVRPETHLSETR